MQDWCQEHLSDKYSKLSHWVDQIFSPDLSCPLHLIQSCARKCRHITIIQSCKRSVHCMERLS